MHGDLGQIHTARPSRLDYIPSRRVEWGGVDWALRLRHTVKLISRTSYKRTAQRRTL